MDNSIELISMLETRHRTQGYIAFIKNKGRDSHTFLPHTRAAFAFEQGYDDAEAQYKSWSKARLAQGQGARP